MKRRLRSFLIYCSGVVVLVTIAAWIFASEIAAYILLCPFRREISGGPPAGMEPAVFQGKGVRLQGWRGLGRTESGARGTVIFLHGVMDNRSSGAWVLTHFQERGYDTIAFDSRAHGDSEGGNCTYGVLEKSDLSLIVRQCRAGPVILVGTSLGAAIAIQTAAIEPRVSAVVAAEVFSDLRVVSEERASPYLSSKAINKALGLTEAWGGFRIEDASPLKAARCVRVPVFLIHGAADTETPPAHTERVFQALAGPKKLSLVPGAHHNHSLHTLGWREIDAWLDSVLQTPP